MKQIKSSMASHCGYDPATQVLSVKFHNGQTAHYQKVPDAVHTALMSSKSFGKYLRDNVIGKFKHE